VLKGNLLFYKDRPSDREAAGVIVLEGCIVQLCESEEQFAFSLVWSEPGLRTYKFSAEDQAGQESWIKALLSANHGYLALLVMDLEKKYRGETRRQRGSSCPRGTDRRLCSPQLCEAALFTASASRRAHLGTQRAHVIIPPQPSGEDGEHFESSLKQLKCSKSLFKGFISTLS